MLKSMYLQVLCRWYHMLSSRVILRQYLENATVFLLPEVEYLIRLFLLAILTLSGAYRISTEKRLDEQLLKFFTRICRRFKP